MCNVLGPSVTNVTASGHDMLQEGGSGDELGRGGEGREEEREEERGREEMIVVKICQ